MLAPEIDTGNAILSVCSLICNTLALFFCLSVGAHTHHALWFLIQARALGPALSLKHKKKIWREDRMLPQPSPFFHQRTHNVFLSITSFF